MEQPTDDDDVVPVLPARGEAIPPPWFERRPDMPAEPDQGVERRASLSRQRLWGALALVGLIILIPVDFILAYRGTDMLGRTSMTLGFVWAVVIEIVALWGLIRLVTRR